MNLLSTNASNKPLYHALGLPETATPEDIHAAFLNISRTHHPDVNGDAEIFSKAKYAHDILMDPAQRKIYDETGLDPKSDQQIIHAFGLIRNIVAGILNDGKVDINIVERLRAQMSVEINGIEAQIRSVEAKAERIRKMSANIEKRWSGSPQIKSNLLMMMEGHIKLAESERVPLDGALQVVNLALKLIDDACYENVAETVYWHGQMPFVEMKTGKWT